MNRRDYINSKPVKCIVWLSQFRVLDIIMKMLITLLMITIALTVGIFISIARGFYEAYRDFYSGMQELWDVVITLWREGFITQDAIDKENDFYEKMDKRRK